MVDPILDQLPDETQSDIMMLLTMTEDEAKAPRDYAHYHYCSLNSRIHGQSAL